MHLFTPATVGKRRSTRIDLLLDNIDFSRKMTFELVTVTLLHQLSRLSGSHSCKGIPTYYHDYYGYKAGHSSKQTIVKLGFNNKATATCTDSLIMPVK